MSYEDIKYSRNFKNLPYGPYDEIASVGGKTIIKYLVPTSKANLESFDFGGFSNYYSDGNEDPEDDNIRVKNFMPLDDYQPQTIDLLLKGSSSNAYSNYFRDVALVDFSKSTDTSAAIVIGGNTGSAFTSNLKAGETPVFTDGYTIDSSADPLLAVFGDVWLNQNFIKGWSGVDTPGTEQFFAILHELAHSIGGFKEAYEVADIVDSQQYTVMSYVPQGWSINSSGDYIASSNALYFDAVTDTPLFASGLQLYDIRNLQEIYYENNVTRGTDTLYSLNNGLGRDNDQSKAFTYTIWDGGGNDTINASGFTDFGALIDLREGQFSSIGENGHGGAAYDLSIGRQVDNVAIAYNTIIENAIGTNHNDYIIGNDHPNDIDGGNGVDSIDGGGDNDTLTGGGNADVLIGGTGNDILNGGSGKDFYVWNLGDGDDDVGDNLEEGGVLVVGPGIPSTSVHVTKNGPDIVVTIDGIGNLSGSVTFKNVPNDQVENLTIVTQGRDPSPLPGPIQAALEQFNIAQSFHCPLVLDLGVSGITLTSVSENPVYWDIDNDGFREASGWVGPEDGLLAVDLNSDGIINNHAELFGTDTQNGFSILAQYDSNADSAITSADTNFSKLLVWVDANSDGYSQADELHTLTALGITSISLATTAVSYSLADNPVTAQATFTQNSVSHQIVSANFAFDNVNSLYDQGYKLDPRALFLPDLRGYGRIADLHIAMSNNEDLLVKVAGISGASLETTFDSTFDVEGKINDILYTWAGVDSLSATGRGGQTVDDREIEFLEELLDRDYLQAGTMVSAVPLGALIVDDAFINLFNAYAARLYAQSELGKLLAGNTYNMATDTFSGFTGLDLDVLDTIKAIADTATDPLHVWQQVVRLIEGAVGIENLSGGDATALEDAIADTYTSHTTADVLASVQY